MEVTKRKPERLAMTFDELSMERSKNFVKAMQELKNLRPQLYSAAEYCEKSYLHSEQKQMLLWGLVNLWDVVPDCIECWKKRGYIVIRTGDVNYLSVCRVLDNLKDYATRALVNAVDHLGTVAYKLTDLLEQQTLDVSTMELKATCINQQLLTCQTFMDKEGLRQQQLLAIIPRHHRRYIFPNLVNKEVHFSSHVRTDPGHIHAQARPCVHPSGSRASKTLSWHLASETKPILKGTQKSSMSSEVQKTYIKSSGTFYLLDDDGSMRAKSSPAHPQLPRGNPAYGVVMQPFGVTHRDSSAGSKPTTPFRSFENPGQHAVDPAPSRSSKSMLLSFFVKQRTPKLKAGTAS